MQGGKSSLHRELSQEFFGKREEICQLQFDMFYYAGMLLHAVEAKA